MVQIGRGLSLSCLEILEIYFQRSFWILMAIDYNEENEEVGQIVRLQMDMVIIKIIKNMKWNNWNQWTYIIIARR